MILVFYLLSAAALALVAGVGLLWPPAWWAMVLVAPLVALGIADAHASTNTVLRNYPAVGHLRYLFKGIGPELNRYFVEGETEGRPYSKEIRELVNARADDAMDTVPFGTQRDVNRDGYEFVYHSHFPRSVPESAARVMVGDANCTTPYSASRLNVSAMSFGAISKNAVLAINQGARAGGFYQNTGEGGLSEYHLRHGGDLVWQLGSGYFSCRTPEGRLDRDEFADKSRLDQVKMVEVKLSQGAKPGHGGILPAAKLTEEIARAREVSMGRDVVQPAAHPEFDTPIGLLEFIAELRTLSGGKPVGFKLCLGSRVEFMGICKAMLETGITPDFITVDGSEGGTGAAPAEFVDHVGTPLNEALVYVHNCLRGIDRRETVRVIASGKVATGFDMLLKTALGADMCNVARPMMFAVGCIQSLRCDTNTCPTGVTTQNPRRVRALVPEAKAPRVAAYHRGTVESFLELVGVTGASHPDELSPDHVFAERRVGCEVTYASMYPTLEPGDLLRRGEDLPRDFAEPWSQADPHARDFAPRRHGARRRAPADAPT